MNQRTTPAKDEIPGIAPEIAPSSAESMNPNLTANLRADYEALQNDMEQAQELAADFQRQLAGKSNDFAQLKQLFEKTKTDLGHLEAGIVELRAERHRLANEGMRATAFQTKLAKVTEERDRLRVDIEVIRQALTRSAEGTERALRERDTMIATLVVETETLKQALAQAKQESGRTNDWRARMVETPQVAPSESAPS
jgi:chromosome segregation ATPase